MAKLTDKFFNRVIEGPLELEAGEKISGDLELASGSKAKIFEDIVDKDDHARFIEGDITIEELTGVSSNYAKWALCGTHLEIVVALTITAQSWSYNTICEIDLPQWIKDKLYPFFSSTTIDCKSIVFFDSSYNSKNPLAFLIKTPQDKIQIVLNTVTFTADSNGRIAFDLLIDND